jgi:hypothetical protein
MLLCSVWLELGIHLILGLLPNECLSTWENGEQWKEAAISFLWVLNGMISDPNEEASSGQEELALMSCGDTNSDSLASHCIALQAVGSWVWFPIQLLRLFIDFILPAALWSWGRSSSNRNEYRGDLVQAGAYGRQPSTFLCQLYRNSGNLNLLEPKGPVHDCVGIALPLLNLSVIS